MSLTYPKETEKHRAVESAAQTHRAAPSNSSATEEQLLRGLNDADQIGMAELICLRDERVSKCRAAGKEDNHDKLVEEAKMALPTLQKIRDLFLAHGDADCEPFLRNEALTASMFGYIGYGLMQRGHHEEALTFLEKSMSLWSEINAKQNASVMSKRERREVEVVERALEHCRVCTSKVENKPSIVKYPRTAHLFDAGGTATTVDDLVLSDFDSIVTTLCDGKTRIVIEEKLDGANLGISWDPSIQQLLVQNRSHFISSGVHAQFSRITEWVETHREALMRILETEDPRNQLIIYGEWLVARHSLPYQRLPGYFVAFDIYDKIKDKFFSRKRFHAAMQGSGIPVAPLIDACTFGPFPSQKASDLLRRKLLSYLDTKSTFRNDQGKVEGIVLRVDDPEQSWLEHRCKVVRPDFVRGCNDGHWASRPIEKQRIDFEFAMDYLSGCYVFATSTDEDTRTGAKVQSKRATSKVDKAAKEYAAQRVRARRRVPRFVMLAGLPGSGKSTFARRLAASAPSEWVVVNQDQDGKKRCIALASKAGKKSRVILDRCHPTVSERAEWYDILGQPSKGGIALVYFAADTETCIKRVQHRKNHETIPEGTGATIVRRVANMLEAPSDEEKRNVFGTVEIVSSFEESNNLLYRWGVDHVCSGN